MEYVGKSVLLFFNSYLNCGGYLEDIPKMVNLSLKVQLLNVFLCHIFKNQHIRKQILDFCCMVGGLSDYCFYFFVDFGSMFTFFNCRFEENIHYSFCCFLCLAIAQSPNNIQPQWISEWTFCAWCKGLRIRSHSAICQRNTWIVQSEEIL